MNRINNEDLRLVKSVYSIIINAGILVKNVYQNSFDYEIKSDNSPLTEADRLSHKLIVNKLKILTPDIPILSEEDSSISFSKRSMWKKYWLIDPLDGTKEFIKKNGEFTINIALIYLHRPVMGMIHIPIKNETYWGLKGSGSFLTKGKFGNEKKLEVFKKNNKLITIITSRSHSTKTSEKTLQKFINIYPSKILHKGSSLKFCSIASNFADFYPRISPTSEWDIAAGDAILSFAGGTILDLDLKLIKYNMKDSYIIPSFIASNNKSHIDNFIPLLKKY
jgi:3'(2'), 5'-bisphosphate nucleotidase